MSGEQREPLRMSLAVAEDFKTALDTITCIASFLNALHRAQRMKADRSSTFAQTFAYSLLFLLRMSSAVRSDRTLHFRVHA